MISKVKLGIYLGIPIKVKSELLNELMLITQPAHLQEKEGRELSSDERDEARSRIIRNRLKGEE